MTDPYTVHCVTCAAHLGFPCRTGPQSRQPGQVCPPHYFRICDAAEAEQERAEQERAEQERPFSDAELLMHNHGITVVR